MATVLYIPHGGGPLPLLDEAGYQNLNHFLRGFHQTIDKPDPIVFNSTHVVGPVISLPRNPKPTLLFR